MKYKTLLAALGVFAGVMAAPLLAQGGRLGTLQQGEYICALPGDATKAAWTEQPGMGFSITGASSYRSASGSGTYLLEDRTLTFTRGPMKGMMLMRLGSGLLQLVEKDGRLGRMRCHRAGPLAD